MALIYVASKFVFLIDYKKISNISSITYRKVCKKNEISHKIDEELLSQDELVFNERKKKNSELEEQEEIKNSQLEPEISDNRSNEGDVEESISGIANLELNESNQNNINNNNETHHNVSHVNNE